MRSVFMIPFLVTLLVMPIDTLPHDTLVIKGRSAGFFSNFLAVVNHLKWCNEHTKNPVVSWTEGFYYDPRGCNGIVSENVWDYYFYPVSEFMCQPHAPATYAYYAQDGFAITTHPHSNNPYPDTSLRIALHGIINSYIRIKETH